MSDQDQDRHQEATPYKLQKARERGQVPKGRDLVSAIVFTVAMLYLHWRGWPTLREQFVIDQRLLAQIAQIDFNLNSLVLIVERALIELMWLGIPFLALLMLAAVVANLIQTGLVFSFEPIQPDFTRLNPVTGFKNMFTSQVLFNLLRTLLKLLLLCLTAWWVLKGLSNQFYQLSSLQPIGFVQTLIDDFAALGLKLCVVLWLIAIIDLRFTFRQFAQKMRMSSKEMKDEIKQREGDPRVRSRLRELRREMRKKSAAIMNTSQASVLLTNPTHIAIALKYEHGKMDAPVVVAKGAGILAAIMRKIAAKHSIPVIHNPALARHLYKTLDVHQGIPPENYAAVARIITWVLAMQNRREALA